MYRISLMLLDKIMQLNEDFEMTKENVNTFFENLGNNYWDFYKK